MTSPDASPRALVSVIIPAFNAEAFIAEAVQSVLAQTYSPIEVIVVNDGSTDGTISELCRFGHHIRIVSQSNRGLPSARNVGASVSTGEWLAFLDADDVWLPEKLERQLAELPGDGCVTYSDRYNVGERGSLPDRQSDVQGMFEGDVFLELLLVGNVITVSSVVMSKPLFEEMGGFCEDLKAAEDWDLWVRVAERHQIYACRQPLVKYRFHGGMMSRDPARMWSARNQVIERALSGGRGAALGAITKRRIRSRTWSTNGWDASRGGLRIAALRAYARAAFFWPFDIIPYRGAARAVVGLD
jgi:teichuronic acid biosynthesis glycosyltransferase TuaG